MTAGGLPHTFFRFWWYKAEGQFVLLCFSDRDEFCNLEGEVIKQVGGRAQERH
jgi:hypothetical protein